MTRCLACPLTPLRLVRGVCHRCLQRQIVDIKAGRTTDAELVAAGLRAPAKKKKTLRFPKCV